MLDEYNTPEALWAEAINTACYASNRLFLQKFLGKTPYELLNGKKSDVSFFRVFGCKCYIYKKRQHLGKFQRYCDIGFLVVTHQSPKHIEYLIMPPAWLKKTYDVEFNESNGSQGAHENLDDVGDEPLREAMKNIRWETSSQKMMKMMYKSLTNLLHQVYHKMVKKMGE